MSSRKTLSFRGSAVKWAFISIMVAGCASGGKERNATPHLDNRSGHMRDPIECWYANSYARLLSRVEDGDEEMSREVVRLLPRVLLGKLSPDTLDLPVRTVKCQSYAVVMALTVYDKNDRSFEFLNELAPEDQQLVLKMFIDLQKSGQLAETEAEFLATVEHFLAKHPSVDRNRIFTTKASE